MIPKFVLKVLQIREITLGSNPDEIETRYLSCPYHIHFLSRDLGKHMTGVSILHLQPHLYSEIHWLVIFQGHS